MRFRTMLLLLILVLVASLVGSAQEITGQIRGTVTDSTGAVVANALVTVTNTDRGQAIRTLHTGPAGEYVAPLLPVGKYSVTVTATGFRTVIHKDIVLNVSDRLTIDAQLAPGSSSETISVEASPDQVNLDTAAVEGLIAGHQVRELPLNNRNYEQLVTLQPGVTSNAADQIYVGTTNPSGQVNIVAFAINGQRQSQNNWTIDGADNLDHGSNITLLVYPSVDAISEFKVERSSYNPEFGRSASGQINVVTRSGSNQLHGSLYEFFRNDWLNANTAYNKANGLARPVLRYNDFGGTIGGPVYIPGIYEKKDKTFFFFSEEVRRVTTPVTKTSTLPSSAMLSGNFTGSVCTAVDSTGACTATGTSIASANWNPIAAAYVKDVFNKVAAMPGTSVNGTDVASQASGIFNYREELYRVDHLLTSKIALMGRYINDSIPTKEPYGLFGPQSYLPGIGNTKTQSPGHQLMGRATFQITEKLYNEIGYAYSYGAITSDPTGLAARTNSPDVASAVNLPYAVTLNRIPTLAFDDFTNGTYGSFGQYRDYNRNHNLFDNFSWTQGNHAMKFGLSFNHYQKEENAAGNNAGSYEFDSTNAVGSTTADLVNQDWANFLLGYAAPGISQTSADFNANIKQNLFEVYAQDQWRVRPNLTVSYGVRYSYFQTPWAEGNNLISFDPAQYSASNAAVVDSTGNITTSAKGTNGYIVGGVNSNYGKFITRQNSLNFAPRLGIAWDPTGKGKTSVRAGYGLFYDSVAAGLIEDNVFNNSSDANLGSFISSPDVAGAGTLPQSLYGTDPKWKTPYTLSWNLDVQQEFGKGWMVDVGYVGNNAKHLTGLIDINQVAPGVALAGGIQASCLKTNGIYSGSAGCGEALNKYRPYQGFMSIGMISPRFKSNYNALQMSVKKQFSRNTTFGAFYTWSKGLTNNQTDRSTGAMYSYCVECEYGRSTLDRRHVFSANFVYDTPWFATQKGLAGHVLGGWEASGILTINTGLPLTVIGNHTTAGDPMLSGYYAPGPPGYGHVSSIRPNVVSDPNSGAPHSWSQWFNTSAFAYVTTPGGIPNEHRGAVNGPGLWRYDMALMKNLKLTEKVNTQFRFEGFNLFNHTNPTTIGTTMGSSLFGKITGSRDGRTLQLAAKILF